MTRYSKLDTGTARTGPGGKKKLARLVQVRSGVGRGAGRALAARFLIGETSCCIDALPAIIVFYGQPAPGFGGAHAPIGAGVFEMVIPIRGGSAHAASSRSVVTRSNLIALPRNSSESTIVYAQLQPDAQ